MDSLLGEVRRLADTSDEVARKKLVAQLQEIVSSLETPDESVEKLLCRHLEIAVIRASVDLGIFRTLSRNEAPLSLDALATITDSDPALLVRLLRYLASVGILRETGKSVFAPTNVAKALAEPGNEGGVCHYFDHVGPQFQKLPTFLAKRRYRQPTESNNTVFQETYATDMSVFTWYPQHQPDTFSRFCQHMASRRDAEKTWLAFCPLDKYIGDFSFTGPFFVDVGGGTGQQCADLLLRYPKLSGHVVLQDIPHSIDHALPTAGVHNTVHDFFEPQSVRSAKIYHLRGVLHDFPDEECRRILCNLIEAMNDSSIIVIEDMVLPDIGANWRATQIDLTMMCAHAAMERTEAQWFALLDSVGLEIVELHTLSAAMHESVLVLALQNHNPKPK